MNIPITKPFFDKNEEKAVLNVVKSGWVTQGPKVLEFEELVAKYVGAQYGVATTSATTSLFLSLYMLGIGPGDEVIVPSLTFIATPNVVVHVGAKPVFVDIDPKTYNINPDLIEKAITKKTKAIIPVDQVGLSCDWEKIKKIIKRYKLHIIEDAACATGSKYKGKRIGSLNNITCFSFHPRKLATTGEGGMILTNDKSFAERAKRLRHHGMGVSDVKRHMSNKIVNESYSEVGYNLRMSDLEAAIGIEQFKKLPKILSKREKLANRYTKYLKDNELLETPFVPGYCTPNWQSYILRLKENKNVSRNNLMQKLLDAGISTRRGQMACHTEAPYKKMYPKLLLPETEKATAQTIALPLYHQMTKKEQDYVIDTILKFNK